MLIRFQDLKALDAIDVDGGRHAVTDLFVRRQTNNVTHVITRLGRWFDRQGCAIGVDAFQQPQVNASEWPFDAVQGDFSEGTGPISYLCGVDEAPSPVDVQRADGLPPLGSISAIDEQPVIARDGRHVGRVMDFVIDTDRSAIAMVVVHAGPTGIEHQRVVPTERISSIDWDQYRLHLACDSEAVVNAPNLHEISGAFEGKWYNRVLAYYGIG